MLGNVFLQDRIRHPKDLPFWIKRFFRDVVTVVAAEVTGRAGGFDKNLEFTGGLGHDSIPDLKDQSHKPFESEKL